MKKMLLVEWPAMSHESVHTMLFRKLGFDVETHQVIELKDMAARVAEFDVAKYDVIIVDVVPLGTTCDDLLSPELYMELKNIVSRAQKRKGTQTQILGMHFSASKKNQLVMEETFEGMFLGQDTPQEKIDSIFEKLKEN
jgi:anion-transporting  ArsA/GET3 family ATPase